MKAEKNYEIIVEKFKFWLDRQIDDMEFLLKSTQDERLKLQREGAYAFMRETKKQLSNVISRER